MAINNIAETIKDVIIGMKKDISHSLYTYSEVIAGLEQTNLFPHLADMNLVAELTVHVNKIEAIGQQLRNYSLFDPSLNDYTAEVDDMIDELTERFHKWTRRKTYAVKDVAQMFGKSRSTIYRWIKQGKLVAQKIDGRWCVGV